MSIQGCWLSDVRSYLPVSKVDSGGVVKYPGADSDFRLQAEGNVFRQPCWHGLQSHEASFGGFVREPWDMKGSQNVFNR